MTTSTSDAPTTSPSPPPSLPAVSKGPLRLVDDLLPEQPTVFACCEVLYNHTPSWMRTEAFCCFLVFLFLLAVLTPPFWMEYLSSTEPASFRMTTIVESIAPATAWALMVPLDWLITILVKTPLQAAVWTVIWAVLGLLYAAPFVIVGGILLATGAAIPSSVNLFPSLPPSLTRLLDFCSLPLLLHCVLSRFAFFAPYSTYANCANSYLTLTSLFDVRPVRMALSLAAACEDMIRASKYPGHRGAEANERIQELEKEVEGLKWEVVEWAERSR
ncbi:hypothetical protein JCM10213_005639 [Rhodosporidiobolus nylandii]